MTQEYRILLLCFLRVRLTTEAAAHAGRKDQYALFVFVV